MDDKPFTSITGATQETAEPKETTAVAASEQAPSTTSKPVRDSSTSTKKLPTRRASPAANSPNPSRDSSPVRPTLKGTTSTRSTTGPGRSRKNSSQDVSPSRSTSTNTNPPSAAAQQRALSSASIPALHPVTSEPTIRAPIPQKPSVTPEIRETPRWPVSPRLRSPPPINKQSIVSPRKIDQDFPATNVQRSSQPTEQQETRPATDSEAEDSLSVPGMRTPARGVSGASSTLETVQEVSQPNTPGNSLTLDGVLEKAHSGEPRTLTEKDDPFDNGATKTIKSKASHPANESGSESGGKGEIKMKSTSAAPAAASRPSAAPTTKSFTTNGLGRGKASGEGSTKNMTVETETVSSIPQVALGGPGGASNAGSIRTKASTETIRPKKEKKKTTRKAPSVTTGTGEQPNSSRPRLHHHHFTREERSVSAAAGSPERANGQGPYSPTNSSSATSPERSATLASRRPSLNLQGVGTMLTRLRPASSKADIFEAKVASAVDEANSSDSEETFVYESNPPDASDRPRRFHSRTPSATSMASQVDQRNGVRSIMDGHHSVAMKKSMKFANSYNSNGPESTTGEDDGKGTARSNMGTGRGTTHHHHLGGRWGRNGGNGHPSLFDNESPFPNAAKSKMAGNNPRTSSRPTSPRVPNTRLAGNGKKSSPISLGYDLDDGADDERTPLISTIRSSRSGRSRRPIVSSIRQLEHQASRHNRSFMARFAGCLVLSLMVLLVISGAIGFMFATTQPLIDVKILALKSVLASEQDLIFDVKVQGRNPNLVNVYIDSANLVVFAKSKYAGTDSEYWKRPQTLDLMRRGLRNKRDDPLDDPPTGDDPNTNPNLEIGKVYDFDTPLTFDASPFKHQLSSTTGQIRIAHPGNDTIPAGSERWGKVIQHEFELILRGTLKYTLPLNSRSRNISVEARATVKPNAADQDPDTVHIISRSNLLA